MSDDKTKEPKSETRQTDQTSLENSKDQNPSLTNRSRSNWKNEWRDRLNRLLKPKTWSTNIVLIIIVWTAGVVVQRGFETFFTWWDLVLEGHFKAPGVTVEYLKPTAVSSNGLDGFALTNGFREFKLNLDDGIVNGYVIFPLKIRNPTRNPVDRVCIDLELKYDLLLKGVRLLDVQHAIRSPDAKRIIIKHSLPGLKWVWPTNVAHFRFKSVEPIDYDVEVYCSFAKDRGFGKVSSIDRTGMMVPFSIAPNPEVKCWYVKTVPRNEAGEGIIPDIAFPLPNPGFFSSNFEDSKAVVPDGISNELQSGHADGGTKVCFETGLDPRAEVDLFLLAKPAPGIDVVPSVRLEGAPGVSFRFVNSPIHFSVPEEGLRNAGKLGLMPLITRATATSSNVVLYWEVPARSNHNIVRVYRSEERALGVFNNLGVKIYDGYGDTNAFELEHMMGPFPSRNTSTLGTNSAGFFLNPPFEPKTNVSARPMPPSNLQFSYSYSEKITGMVHIADSPPASNLVFTYTLYFFDDTGGSSYPVVVNAIIDSSATRRGFRKIP